MRLELSEIKSDCKNEWKTFKQTFQSILKKMPNS